jgi:transcriptional regulator with XRE-family HTH domain
MSRYDHGKCSKSATHELVAANLRSTREAAEVTAEHLCDLVSYYCKDKLTRQVYERWENGDRQSIPIYRLRQIAFVLNVPFEYFFIGINPPSIAKVAERTKTNSLTTRILSIRSEGLREMILNIIHELIGYSSTVDNALRVTEQMNPEEMVDLIKESIMGEREGKENAE